MVVVLAVCLKDYIKKHTIDTAQFWLKDDSGRRLEFQHGKVVIVLSLLCFIAKNYK